MSAERSVDYAAGVIVEPFNPLHDFGEGEGGELAREIQAIFEARGFIANGKFRQPTYKQHGKVLDGYNYDEADGMMSASRWIGTPWYMAPPEKVDPNYNHLEIGPQPEKYYRYRNSPFSDPEPELNNNLRTLKQVTLMGHSDVQGNDWLVYKARPNTGFTHFELILFFRDDFERKRGNFLIIYSEVPTEIFTEFSQKTGALYHTGFSLVDVFGGYFYYQPIKRNSQLSIVEIGDLESRLRES